MNVAIKVAEWVQKKPMILIRFDEEFTRSLHNSQKGFEHLTIVKPHWVFQDFKLPTLCLLEIQEWRESKCYLATITRKSTVSTFDSRLTIKKLRAVTQTSLQEFEAKISDVRMKRMFNVRVPGEVGFSRLSPKLSAHLIEVLAEDPSNHAALEAAFSLLPRLHRRPDVNWAQDSAIQSAMAVFGVQSSAVPKEVRLKRGAQSGLSMIGSHLYEDNVVHADASRLPGFDSIASDVTGRAIFVKGDERLVIYTANKLPLEQMLGVDLIYINETRGNAVMVQYKMLEEGRLENGSRDWLFRPDAQLRREIGRMKLPGSEGALSDYRLNRSPFFFKFVKRKKLDDSHQSFLVSLEHLNQILIDPECRGPKGGIRISYKSLSGAYLRETDMASLIRSGYVGTHRAETEALAIVVAEVARGNRAVVLAWQQRMRKEGELEVH